MAELEHILCLIKSIFLVYKDTFDRRAYYGIPGDVFIKTLLADCAETEKSAKEFVKFNERCMI
jgi:hypothetical protein